MPTITRFEDIQAWKMARELTRLVYTLSNRGTFAQDFGLKDQMRRAAVSIMSNIAEGFESRTQSQFIQHLGHAKASAGELRSQAYVALDVEHITDNQFQELTALCKKCSGQISRFMTYLQSNSNSRRVREDRIEYDVGTLE
jgi:four helix bundle protein